MSIGNCRVGVWGTVALSDVQAAAQVFPTTPVSTSAGVLPLRAVMVAIANVENPGWGNQAGDRIGSHGVLPDGTPWSIDASGPDGTGLNGKWNCNGYTSWGTWQINLPEHSDLVSRLMTESGAKSVSDPCTMAQWLSDYTHNALVAAYIVGNGDGLSNWTSYTHSDKWKQYISQGLATVPATTSPVVAPPVTQPTPSSPTQPIVSPPFMIPAMHPPLFGLKPTTLIGLGLAAVGIGYLFSR